MFHDKLKMLVPERSARYVKHSVLEYVIIIERPPRWRC